jgi:hypothetical protein
MNRTQLYHVYTEMKTKNTLPVHLPYLNAVFRNFHIILIVTSLTFPSLLPVSDHANRGVMLGVLVGFSRTDLQNPKRTTNHHSDKHFPHLYQAQTYTARAAILDSITRPHFKHTTKRDVALSLSRRRWCRPLPRSRAGRSGSWTHARDT